MSAQLMTANDPLQSFVMLGCYTISQPDYTKE